MFFSEFAKKSYAEYGAEIINLYQGSGMPVILTSVMVCNQDRSFTSYREEATASCCTAEDIYRHLSGAKLVSMHVGFLDVYKRLKEEGTVLIFDTGWEDDLSIEKYEDYLRLADYYLPNQKEALKITGTNTVEAAAEKLSAYFPQAIIKLDKDGCLLRNSAGTQFIPSMKGVTAVDSTGAGDAFMSGFMYGLFHGHPIEQCIRFGNAFFSEYTQYCGKEGHIRQTGVEHILPAGSVFHQGEILIDGANRLLDGPAGPSGSGLKMNAVHEDRAAVAANGPVENAEQRGFSSPRRADHRHKLALADGKTHIDQRVCAVLKFFTDMLDFQQHKQPSQYFSFAETKKSDLTD